MSLIPEDSIGIDATDYLLDLGFDCASTMEYIGDCIIDEKIIADDSHPEHSEMLREYIENSDDCIEWYSGKHVISIRWSSGKIISYSDDFPPEILSTLKKFIDSKNKIIYISNQKLSEFEERS